MPEGYWGDKVNPQEDDWDLWINPGEDPEEDEIPPEEEVEIEEMLGELDEIIDELGPPAVLEAVSQYLYDLPRPFARVAKKVQDLAERTKRTVGAVEEARQTRGQK